MKRINLKRGFTLIELLVVVAIIGILSSVVLGSLKTARDKAADAAIKADLSGIRASAEALYDTNGGEYGSVAYQANGDCGAAYTVGSMFSVAGTSITIATAHIKTQNGGAAMKCNQNATGQSYAIAVTLKSGTFWCIDSAGVSRGTTATGTNYSTIDTALASYVIGPPEQGVSCL
jgi:prepilin-type N-terminal cleavage/methylation domain-containing protein